MFDPIHPARRAVADNGLRCSMIFPHKEMLWNDEEICDGQVLEVVVKKKRLGLLLAASRSHLVRYDPSSTLFLKIVFWLFSSYSSLHASQKKSAIGLLFGNGLIFVLSQFGQ